MFRSLYFRAWYWAAEYWQQPIPVGPAYITAIAMHVPGADAVAVHTPGVAKNGEEHVLSVFRPGFKTVFVRPLT